MQRQATISTIVLCLILSACGGGSGGLGADDADAFSMRNTLNSIATTKEQLTSSPYTPDTPVSPDTPVMTATDVPKADDSTAHGEIAHYAHIGNGTEYRGHYEHVGSCPVPTQVTQETPTPIAQAIPDQALPDQMEPAEPTSAVFAALAKTDQLAPTEYARMAWAAEILEREINADAGDRASLLRINVGYCQFVARLPHLEFLATTSYATQAEYDAERQTLAAATQACSHKYDNAEDSVLTENVARMLPLPQSPSDVQPQRSPDTSVMTATDVLKTDDSTAHEEIAHYAHIGSGTEYRGHYEHVGSYPVPTQVTQETPTPIAQAIPDQALPDQMEPAEPTSAVFAALAKTDQLAPTEYARMAWAAEVLEREINADAGDRASLLRINVGYCQFVARLPHLEFLATTSYATQAEYDAERRTLAAATQACSHEYDSAEDSVLTENVARMLPLPRSPSDVQPQSKTPELPL